MVSLAFFVTQVSWQECRQELYKVRRLVFIEEQKVPAEIEIDEWDALSQHVLARCTEGEPVGCGRLLPDGHIGRMAVLSTWRGCGVGQALLVHLLELARAAQMPEVLISAQVHALGFYEKAGFQAEGERYEEAGILHQAMRLKLSTPGTTL